jgi:UDP-N-acetylmuramyl pentapeptide phosphotransferase/UDP-N-acetylglucosamine-1-phosphate transferase
MTTALDLLWVVCAPLSALVTWLSIRYAQRNALLDLPGQRRSHSVPTPRGGGIGIVVAVLAGLAVAAISNHLRNLCESAAAAVVLVASIGWIDDHRGLSARLRVLVHLAAVVLLYLPLFGFAWFLAQFHGANADAAPPLHYAILLPGAIVFVLANVWFVNLHNFMDGINGLLACQAIFVFLALASLVSGDSRALLLLCAAAVAGFLPFNFPRARVFMGGGAASPFVSRLGIQRPDRVFGVRYGRDLYLAFAHAARPALV